MKKGSERMDKQLFGYIDKNTPIHRINSIAKLIFFIIATATLMFTYDTRFLLGMSLFSLILLKVSQIKWQDIKLFVYLILVFSVMNLLAVYVVSPEYGVELYGTRHVLWEGYGRFTLTKEQLFYEFNLLLKYLSTVPLILVFLFTTNPSEFASSFNRIGIPYRVAYAISLTLRYIPDIQEDFLAIKSAQDARGISVEEDESFKDKAQSVGRILMPLIISSFERIETVSHAMMLRRFGTKKKRTWYVEKPLTGSDYAVIACGIGVLGLFILTLYLNKQRFYNPFL